MNDFSMPSPAAASARPADESAEEAARRCRSILEQDVETWNAWMRDRRMTETDDASFQSGLERIEIRDADFSRRYLCHAKFRGSRIERTSFRRCNLRGADFSGCELIDVDLGETLLNGVDFRGARLTRVRFDGAQLFCCRFGEATLEQAPISRARVCIQTLDTMTHLGLRIAARRALASARMRAERAAFLAAWAPYAAARYLRNRRAPK